MSTYFDVDCIGLNLCYACFNQLNNIYISGCNETRKKVLKNIKKFIAIFIFFIPSTVFASNAFDKALVEFVLVLDDGGKGVVQVRMDQESSALPGCTHPNIKKWFIIDLSKPTAMPMYAMVLAAKTKNKRLSVNFTRNECLMDMPIVTNLSLPQE